MSNLDPIATLQKDAAQFNIVLTPQEREQFAAYLTLLLEWNQHTNLTAIRAPLGIVRRHFLDALSCEQVTGSLNGNRLIDIGTGAGLPGIPLKIRYPELRLTLVDSVGKKARFLEDVCRELGFEGVTISVDRAEQLGRDEAHREQYDWAVARGVANMATLAEYLLPLCRVTGRLLAMKGSTAPAETSAATNAITQLGGGNASLHSISLPEQDTPHFLVVVEKIKPTPAKYPRRVGIPSKRPLT